MTTESKPSSAINRRIANSIVPLLIAVALTIPGLIHAADPDSSAVGIAKKLDAQLVLALKKSRGQAPFDRATALEPDIPIRDGDRVLVDIQGSVSKRLLDQVAVVGGRLVNGSATATTFRAMIPLLQLESLARRADVKSISPAQLTITSGVKR